MEVKSIWDCLKFVDSMILSMSNIEKHIGIGNLEDVRDYIIGMYNGENVIEMVSISVVLSQVNLIIDRFYFDKESDIKEQYSTLTKRILAWRREISAKPEADKDE